MHNINHIQSQQKSNRCIGTKTQGFCPNVISEVNSEDNLYQHSSSEDEVLVKDNKQSTGTLMFDATSIKNLLEVSDHASLLRIL